MSTKISIPNYSDKAENEESGSQTKDSTKDDAKILGKKKVRTEKKPNNEYCSYCRQGGNLILCDKCVRSFHLECLKINEEDLPEGNWYCPICTTREKKEAESGGFNMDEYDERERKRLIKNEKRRIWRRKKKEEEEALKKQINYPQDNKKSIETILTNSGIMMPLDSRKGKSYLGVISRMERLPLNNSKICLNLTYSQKIDEDQRHNLSLSLPLLFPIPNNILLNFYEKSKNLYSALNKRKITKYIFEHYDLDENQNDSIYPEELIDIDEDNISNDFNTTEEVTKILKLPNSVKALNNIINEDRDILRYNTVLRDYWNVILEKKSSTAIKHIIKYPINSKELYSFPDYYGLDEKYFNKTEGIIYPYFNGKLFTRIINIYDFILTFSPNIYITNFTIEEFYAALLYSERYYKSEISLLASIHISLVFLLMCELSEMSLLDLYNKKEIELIILKVIIEHKKIDIKSVFIFIQYSWPELIRLFLVSNTFNKNCDLDIALMEKIYNLHDTLTYNTCFNLDEKFSILEKLIFICYETNFVRNIIRDDQDKRIEIKKKEKELDEQLREIEIKKKEMERQHQFTQPEQRIEEINNKIKSLPQTRNKAEYKKNKSKLEAEKEKFDVMINELNDINKQRDELTSKISSLKEDNQKAPFFNKSYLGIDGRGYKYYYFNWMENLIFMRVYKKEKESNDEKYEWRVISGKDTLYKDVIDKLSEKGIEENELKIRLNKIYPKINNPNKEGKLFSKSIDEIFKTQSLKYKNLENPAVSDEDTKIELITENSNLFKKFAEQIKNIEINITKFLTKDNRQWESVANREKIDTWLFKIDDISKFVSLLLFFNERIKCPYKAETVNKETNKDENYLLKPRQNKKVLEDEKSENSSEQSGKDKKDKKDKKPQNLSIFNENGKIQTDYINDKLQFANRIRLWTKENESYNVEKLYLSYLRTVRTFPQLYICLNLLEIAINELNKRKEYYRKKEKVEPTETQVEEPKITENININDENVENNSSNNNTNNNNTEKRKTIYKKKKLIDWNVECMFCQEELGDLLYCDKCPNVAHLVCTKLKAEPDVWLCPNCQNKK